MYLGCARIDCCITSINQPAEICHETSAAVINQLNILSQCVGESGGILAISMVAQSVGANTGVYRENEHVNKKNQVFLVSLTSIQLVHMC